MTTGAALGQLMKLIEDGILVRNIRNDGDPVNYLRQSTSLVLALKDAQVALESQPVAANKGDDAVLKMDWDGGVMREKFIAWFRIKYLDLELDGPTGKGEWETFSAGYMAGMERTIEIYEGKSAVDVPQIVKFVAGSPYTPDTDSENAAKPEVVGLDG